MTAPSRATIAGQAYLDLRRKARQDRRPVDELIQLYVLESFLARLAQTPFAERFVQFLPLASYPIRAGTHANTAFALALAWDYATVADDWPLAEAISERAYRWYGQDTNCQAWEPDGDAFLSPALIEAECMRRILAPPEFTMWFARFLPDVGLEKPSALFAPARVSDRTDGKIAHLDGLNLSRAWCWRGIATALDEPERSVALAAAERHLQVSLPEITGDYAGEHWLASFALLALS